LKETIDPIIEKEISDEQKSAEDNEAEKKA
jgi:hypothetical protein